MQLKMEKGIKTPVNTPKGIKKTPKKGKETPLKKDENTKTPKMAKQTPLKKGEATKTPKTINTPKLDKKSPKQNNNVTPKQLKQEGQKTPQKNQNTPKGNKKQKLDENKSKEINTQIEKATSNLKKNISTGGSRVRVNFPRFNVFTYDEIQKLFEGCKHAYLQSAWIQYDSEISSQKVEELKKIRINGKPLKVYEDAVKISTLKKTIRMKNEENAEKAKKFFKAKSLEKLINRFGKHTGVYILTFENEKAAASASKEQFELDGKVYKLAQYYEKTSSAVKKPNEPKQNLEQKKRKADEVEEEESEEEEDDNTMEGIEIDEEDDDDDEDDDEDDDDDDDDEDDDDDDDEDDE